MLKPMEKIKLSKERIALIAQLKDGSLTGMAKVKASKRVVELVVLLGGGAGQAGDTASSSESESIVQPSNPLYQSVIDGAEINISLIEQVIEEAKKNGDDETHGQLVQAIDVIKAWAREQGMPDEAFDSLFDSLYDEDYKRFYYTDRMLLIDGL